MRRWRARESTQTEGTSEAEQDFEPGDEVIDDEFEGATAVLVAPVEEDVLEDGSR